MGATVLLTGASGALGPHLLAELLRSPSLDRVLVLLRGTADAVEARFDALRRACARVAGSTAAVAPGDRQAWGGRVDPLRGDIGLDGLGLASRADRTAASAAEVIVHAAALTRFHATRQDLRAVNVEGTRRVIDFAGRCRRLRTFVFVSTACVAGARTGSIAEAIGRCPPDFVNEYERSKWEAEQVVASSALPAAIARLGTCVGSERDGYVHRFGAVHRAIGWLTRGLIPIVPGSSGATVDLIASEVAARWLARAAFANRTGVFHVAAGARAPRIAEVLDCVVDHLRSRHAGPRRIDRPLVADATTFGLFRRSVDLTGDRLFGRVMRSTDGFLPALLHPKVYETAHAEELWGGALPLSDWRVTLRRVIDFGCSQGWRRPLEKQEEQEEHARRDS